MTEAEWRESFEREALPHLAGLYYFALKLSADEGIAQDLVQETCLRAYGAWERFALGTNCRAWLMRILYREFLKQRQRERRWITYQEDYLGEQPATWEAEVGAEVFGKVLDKEVQAALDELPERFRAVVILSDLDELRYAEIAQVLGIPEGTVKSRLARGREHLRNRLIGYARARGLLGSVTQANGSAADAHA